MKLTRTAEPEPRWLLEGLMDYLIILDQEQVTELAKATAFRLNGECELIRNSLGSLVVAVGDAQIYIAYSDQVDELLDHLKGPSDVLEDGFGNCYPCCSRPGGCQLEVVRPGKTQCICEDVLN